MSITLFFFNFAACSGEYSLFSGSCNRRFGEGLIQLNHSPRNIGILGTKWVLRSAGGRIKARLVAFGWNQGHGTPCAVVAVKNNFGRPRNGALAQGELLTQQQTV